MGGSPLVRALQTAGKPLASVGNRTMFPLMYSLQWRSYTGLPVISSKTARAGQNFRCTAKNRDPIVFSSGHRKTSEGVWNTVWSGKEMQRLPLHPPTYNAINRCSNASSLYVWVHIWMSWWLIRTEETKSVFSWHITHASWNQRSVTTLRSGGRQATQLRPTQPTIPDSEFVVRYALLV